MITLKKIICAFARSTRRTARTNLPVAEEDNLHQEELIEQEFQDDIEPLSYDKQVQESIKEKIAQELKFNYEGQDPNPHKLVHRPSKGAAWGLGGQLMLASRKVQLEGLKPETDDIT